MSCCSTRSVPLPLSPSPPADSGIGTWQLPLLEIDGLNLTQAAAMVQYLARKHKLVGDSPEEAVKCDMIFGATTDLAQSPMARCFKPDQAEAVAAMQTSLDKFGPRLEACVEPTGFMVGTRLSYADVMTAEVLTSFLECLPECLTPYPKLKVPIASVVLVTSILLTN